MMTPETPTERAAVVTAALTCGAALSTREIMEMTGLRQSGAYVLMYRISRVMPLYLYAGKWQFASEFHTTWKRE